MANSEGDGFPGLKLIYEDKRILCKAIIEFWKNITKVYKNLSGIFESTQQKERAPVV